MRIAEPDLIGIGQAQTTIELDTVLHALGTRHDPMLHRAFGVLVDQLVRRVEACGGRLRDIGNTLAQQIALFGGRGCDQVDPVERDRPFRDAHAVPREPHGGQTEG